MSDYDPAAVMRLLERAYGSQVRVEDGGCWTWLGRRDHGVAVVRLDGVNYSVRRVLHGIEAGKRLRATCENATCVNPAHMTLAE